MDILKAEKKLKEIKADAYNNLSSGEDESELQLESSTELHNCDSAAGEEVKPDRPKAENVKEYKTLSRTTPMDGKTRPKEDIYVNDATLKAPSSEEIWSKLEDLKKNQGVPWKDQNQPRTGPSGLPIQRLGSDNQGPPIRQEQFATPEHSLQANLHSLLQLREDMVDVSTKPNMAREWKQLRQQIQQFFDKYRPQ